MRYVSENGLTFGAFLDFAYHAPAASTSAPAA
jgi:hypothetical protein